MALDLFYIKQKQFVSRDWFYALVANANAYALCALHCPDDARFGLSVTGRQIGMDSALTANLTVHTKWIGQVETIGRYLYSP
jgi:hypothetical protein